MNEAPVRLSVAQRAAACRVECEALGLIATEELVRVVAPRPREKLVTGGWQAGKSVSGALDIWLDLPLLRPGRRYLYWIIVPNYLSPHKEYDYVKEWAEGAGILASFHTPAGSSCKLWLKTSLGIEVLVETKSGIDVEGIAGEPCDGVLVVEAGQMAETVYAQVQGRIITRKGWITYSGTLEADEIKPQWAWFGDYAEAWQQNPVAGESEAFSLPSWANRYAFPGGENDPEIERMRRNMPPLEFARKIAGVPVGVPYPIYTNLQGDGLTPWLVPGWDGDLSTHPFHFEVTDDVAWVAGKGAGGHDYGESYGHPSTLVACTVTEDDVAVVRNAWSKMTNDAAEIETMRRLMSQRYQIPKRRWGFDPTQREAAEIRGTVPIPTGSGSRFTRVGLTKERLSQGRLKYDLREEGVRKLFEQSRRVHLIRKLVTGKGEVYDYHRDDDDLVAAKENAMYVLTRPYYDFSREMMPAQLGAPTR